MSNQCLKPPALMKLKRKKFSGTVRSQPEPYTKPKRSKNKEYCHGDEMTKRELLNPFKTSKKVTNLLEIPGDSPKKRFHPLAKPNTVKHDVGYVLPQESNISNVKQDTQDTDQTGYTQLPTDWALKTEFKVLSETDLKWCSKSALSSCEEATATHLFSANSDQGDAQDRIKLQTCLSYWTHPNIPWLKLFPRDKPSVSKSDGTILKQDALTSLVNEWETAFESLLGVLKTGHCPYFYLCSHSTTVLFRGPNTDCSVLQADMVPTTYGVRNSLKNEDIEFTMPLAADLMRKGLEQENLDENVGSGDAGDAREFLDSIGIDSKKYSNLDPNTVKIQAAGRLKLDHGIRSLVRIRGNHVLGLFNYLINNKSLIPTVGELAGVPPTLLSPTVFVGGTIRHNQTKCGSSQARGREGAGYMEQVHYLHVSGPLLPSSLTHLHLLLAHNQEQYTATLPSLQNSTAFNAPDPPPPPPPHLNTSPPAESANTDNVPAESAQTAEQPAISEGSVEPVQCNILIHELEYRNKIFHVR